METQVPVTAKLSRRFYERLGDDIANELVDWFNSVDLAYRSDLRELNEVNFARFDAKLEQPFAEQDAKWEARFAQLEAKMDARFAQLEAKMDARFAQYDVKLERFKSDLVKWMFLFWTGSVIAQTGLLFALLRDR
jgi:hypothetical protein